MFLFPLMMIMRKQVKQMSSKYVEVNGLRIGEGQPKICIPVVAENIEEIKKQASRIMLAPADLVEWRVDYLRRADDIPSVLVALDKLKEQLEEKPILFTFRTKAEGGDRELSKKQYAALCEAAILSGKIQLIDLEYMLGEAFLAPLMQLASEKQVRVILSNHDFEKTPSMEEIVSRLKGMKAMGADIAKIAVMPQNPADVLTLLGACEHMRQEEEPVPVIAISMGPLGVISRMAGEVFGSVLTFASAEKISAPGQMDADELDIALNAIHQAMAGIPAGEVRKRQEKKNNVALVGFMGTGKTTVGHKICEKSQYELKEIDELIEASEGMTIARIFEERGEKAFRNIETETVKKVTQVQNTVISCGGGTVLRTQNLEMLRASGRIVLLRAKPETVLERVKKNGDKRPLLSRYLSRGYISWLMKKRRAVYEAAADYVIDVDGKTADAVADEILTYMRQS